jgi:hypothetical protein
MKKNTTVSVDHKVIDQLHDLGLTLSGFTQFAVDALLTEGFDDFTQSLKIKMIERELEGIEEEILTINNRLKYLQGKQELYNSLRELALDSIEVSRITNAITTIMKKINQTLIVNDYDKGIVMSKHEEDIKLIKELNPEFDIDIHIERFKRLME